ncbi:PD-(D/E)XK nuclease family protein [Marinimicrobium agarilyticum]|uniref:PD-(D/E)XK nuclease family protein n=1 Tax=Marinimicrobium agarilyticum TaxID=306546 RepID=UPI0003F65762|nr:PD-(D/E)XK nuclease family protein [Marinimicrobium agarilyticum]
MATSLFDLEPLIPALEADEPILTANDRLRRHLLKAWSQYQKSRGRRAWSAPRVWPLNRWLDLQWQALVERGHPGCDRALANRHQRQWIWEQIIGQAEDTQALLQLDPLAQQADGALRSLTLWQVEPSSLREDPYLNSNTRSFLGWLEPFEQRLANRQLMAPEAAHTIIARAFENGALARLPRLWLLGFDALPPLHQRIIDAASAEARQLVPGGAQEARCRRVSLPDTETELRTAALWSLEQLQADPEAVIGIIVPDLGQRRDQVERVFADVFEPTAILPDRPRYTLPFNFSAGVPLGSTALIQSALSLLSLLREQWPLNDLCTLLQNPFWGDLDTELVWRTQLVARLRELGKFEISGSDLRYHGQALAERMAPENANAQEPDGQAPIKRLQLLDEQRRRLPAVTSARQWAQAFQTQLDTLGWPGTRRLDSQEYQQMGLWHELLEAFSALEATGTDMTLSQALGQLAQLAQQTPFQAQTPDSPVQILGALEGAGLRFSHCWVVGLHQRQWPPVPAPNPLLPLELQRDRQMPHASAERELQYASSLTRHYQQCAEEVIFSAPDSDEQGHLSPSPLIRDLPETPLEAVLSAQHGARTRFEQALTQERALTLVPCANGPAFATDDKAPGGSSLFKAQAACPFNAFAQLRLGARAPDRPVMGLSPAERGTLLHGVLASLWKTLGDSHALHAMEETALSAMINELCERTLAPIRQRRPKELGPEYCALEQERLSDMVHRWLTLEKDRPPFRVLATEERRQITFQGLTLTLFIDRIDELENGERLLIDYKTGADLNARQWLGERPEEPQLPLYTVTDPESVHGVAFAQLNPKALQWIGLGALSTPLSGLQPVDDWDAQQGEWQTVLSELAHAFIQGDARVDFKDAKAQRYSADLIPLNRILEKDTISRLLANPADLEGGKA